MDALISSNDFILVYIRRLGLIGIMSATLHAVTYNFFQLTFLHFVVLYCVSAALSVIIYPHRNATYHSIFLYALFGLGLAFVRTS